MELILRRDDGNTVPIKSIETLESDSKVLFFFTHMVIRRQDIEELEEYLSKKTGIKCIILDGRFAEKMYGV